MNKRKIRGRNVCEERSAVSVNSVNGIKLTNVKMKQIKDLELEKQLDLFLEESTTQPI